MKQLIVCLIGLAFVVVGSAGAQNLLTDGGFEIGGITGPDEWIPYDTGDPIGAWTATSSDAMVFGACDGGAWGNPPFEGCMFANLGDGYGPGRIEQPFATTPGAEYEVRFWSSEYANNAGETGEATIRVYNDGGDDLLDTWIHDLTWREFVFTFVATDTTSTLEFTNTVGGPDKDAVSIDAVSVILMGPKVGTVDPDSVTVFEDPGLGSNTDTFTVVLDSPPGATDTITVDFDPNGVDGVDFTVNPTQLAFTTADWDTPQTVTVTAIDDALVEGDEVGFVGFTITSAESDPDFVNARLSSVVIVTILDDDSDGINISKTGVSVNEEGTTSETYEVVPQTAISGDTTVYIGIPNPADPNVPEPLSEVTVNGASTAQLTFTTGDWSTPQTVTVTAIDDAVADGDPHNETIGHTVKSDDLVYHHIGINSVDVTITDNDCGSWGYDYYDRDQDCYVTLVDFAEFAAAFLGCTDPYKPGCVQ